MCNAFNGIAIVLCFRGISSVTGFSEAIWQVIITLAIIISTWYSANYFAALEARRDKRRYLLLAWVGHNHSVEFYSPWRWLTPFIKGSYHDAGDAVGAYQPP
ncbi:Uncharacterised protein [Klebsiella pneumoniae]|uniref:Uncharacterized protein n=1 Tax=Klebsiella pneumoniae TaxID=573 RepID=A0A378C555_KLEPN|nr:Uncharacterised protein [Klebsiella pneumoniae]